LGSVSSDRLDPGFLGVDPWTAEIAIPVVAAPARNPPASPAIQREACFHSKISKIRLETRHAELQCSLYAAQSSISELRVFYPLQSRGRRVQRRRAGRPDVCCSRRRS